jgi:hypothetical protein
MRLQPLRAAAADVTSASQGSTDLDHAKQELLSWVAGTKRGSNTTKLLRGQIEEAQVRRARRMACGHLSQCGRQLQPATCFGAPAPSSCTGVSRGVFPF